MGLVLRGEDRCYQAFRDLKQDLKDWEALYRQHAQGRPLVTIILKYGPFRRKVMWPLDPGEVDDAVRRLHLPSGVTVRWEYTPMVLLASRVPP